MAELTVYNLPVYTTFLAFQFYVIYLPFLCNLITMDCAIYPIVWNMFSCVVISLNKFILMKTCFARATLLVLSNVPLVSGIQDMVKP